MDLYQLPFSHYSSKVRLVLLEKGLSVSLSDIPGGSQTSEEYLAINPTGLVPCLVDGDLVLGESEVIAEYLEDQYPEIPMLPTDAKARAKSRWLSRIHDLQLGPRLTNLYVLSLDGDPSADVVEQELTALFSVLDLVEQSVQPAPFFFGGQFGISDASYVLSLWYAMVLSEVFGQPLSQDRFPKLLTWFEHASRRASAVSVLYECKATLGMADESVAAAA